MEGSFANTEYSPLGIIEEGRRKIFQWSENRQNKRSGFHGTLYKITKLFITRSLVRSFMHNLSVVVAFQMLLAAICTYSCVKLGLEIDVHMSLFVSPIVFPLAFSINANYQRRETVLEDLAMFKSASSILFFCHRDWIIATEIPIDLLKTLSNKLKFLVINIREFLLTEDSGKRKFILQAIYEDFSDIAQLNDKIRTSPMKSNSSLVARIIHCHNLMCWSFEKLRVIREYNSPRSLRAFTKVFIFLMPLLLSPYYVFSGRQTESTWAPYYISVMVSFLFGSLQAVQDKLDDPFDGIGEDDVNLGQLDDWTTQSLLTNRTVTIGRFTVTTTTAKDDHSSNTSPVRTNFLEQHFNEEPGSPTKPRRFSINPEGSPHKLRRILSRRQEKNNETRRSVVAEMDETKFSDQLEARCHGIASKLEGLSGTSIILPGNRVPYVFQEYQGLKSPVVSSIPPTINEHAEDSSGNTLSVVDPGTIERKGARLRLDNRLAAVNESDEEHSPTVEISPVSEKVLLNMKSDSVIRPEDSSKSDKRPTVLGLFAPPSDEQDNTNTKVRNDVLTSPGKTDRVSSTDRVGISPTGEDFPLLHNSDSAPVAKPECDSSVQTLDTSSTTYEKQHGNEKYPVTTHPTQADTSESELNTETDGALKLRFCLVGKRGTRGKSDGVGLWGRRRHKKKHPAPSKENDLSESHPGLKDTSSLSRLLPEEIHSEGQCSDMEEFFQQKHESEKTLSSSNYGITDDRSAGRRSAGRGSADKRSAERTTTCLPHIGTHSTDTQPLNTITGGEEKPEIVVSSPIEEESSLWDFDVSSDRPNDRQMEEDISDTTQMKEDLLSSSKEKSAEPENVSNSRDSPSSENICKEQGGSRFSVSTNTEPEARTSKPSRSRFTISPS